MWTRRWVYAFAAALLSGVAYAQAVSSPYDRGAWMDALSKRDYKEWTRLVDESIRANYPSVATALLTQVVLEPRALPPGAQQGAAIPEFEIQAIRYLANGYRNKRVSPPADQLRARTKALMSKRSAADMTAMMVLADFRNLEDVPLLASVASDPDPNRYRAAILALRQMCLPTANAELVTLKQATNTSQAKKDFIASSEDVSNVSCAR
jgi:hypothetical protein